MSRLQEVEKKKKGRLGEGHLTNFNSPERLPPTHACICVGWQEGWRGQCTRGSWAGHRKFLAAPTHPSTESRAQGLLHTQLVFTRGATRSGSDTKPQEKASI